MAKKKSVKKKAIVVIIIIILVLAIIYFSFFRKPKIEFGSSDYFKAFNPQEKIVESTDINLFDVKTNPFEKEIG